MVKKGLVVGAAVVLLLGLLFGRDAASYVKAFAGQFRNTVRESVPVEFELTRARQMIKDLDPEIHRNMHLIAKEEVEVKNLKEQLATGKKNLEKSESDINRLNGDLKRGESTFVYCGKSYTAKQVEADLTNRFALHRTKEATLSKLEQILTAREKGLAAGRSKLVEMQNSKDQMEVAVTNLEARLEMVKVAQTTSSVNFDNSQLSRTKDTIKDIAARIDVAERLVQANTESPGQINLDETTESNITQQVTEYFHNRETKDAEAVAVKLD